MFALCIIVDAATQRVKIWWNWAEIVINKKTKSHIFYYEKSRSIR